MRKKLDIIICCLLFVVLLVVSFSTDYLFANDGDTTIGDATPGDATLGDPEEEEPPVFDNIEDAGAYLRAQMKERKEKVVIGYSAERPEGFLNTLFNEAVKHTGVPNEGDYLRYQHASYGVPEGGQYFVGSTPYFQISIKYYSTKEQEEVVGERIDEILESMDLDNKSDYQKVREIYFYICQNLKYAVNNKGETDEERLKYRSVYTALTDGNAVCQAYASLFYRMTLSAGLDSRFIFGKSKDNSGKELGHGWNIVRIDNSYYYVDSTWDSLSAIYKADCYPRSYKYFLRGSNSTDFFVDKEHIESEKFAEEYAKYIISEEDYNCDDSDYVLVKQYSDDIVWKYNVGDRTLSIEGEGSLDDYTVTGENTKFPPWYEIDATKVVISNGITGIGTNAFFKTTNLSQVVIPESVTSIGSYAFYRCPSLTSVTIPDSVTEIGLLALGYVYESSTNKKVEGFTINCGNESAAEAYAYKYSFNCNRPVNELEAPENITLSYAAGTGVTISWDPVANAKSYTIKRVYTEDGEAKYKYYATDGETVYIDNEVTAGKYYQYWVTGVLGVLETYNKPSVNIRVLDPPASLVVSEVLSDHVVLNWEAVEGATVYHIYRKKYEDTDWGEKVASVTGTQASVYTTKLDKGALYQYKVYALNGTFTSEESNIVEALTPFKTISSLKVASSNYNSATLTWEDIENADGYQVYRSTSEDGTYGLLGSVNVPTRVCPNLSTGTTYYFKVRAFRKISGKTYYGAYSKTISVKPSLTKPVISSVAAASTSKITVTWNTVSDAKYYELYRSTAVSGAAWTKVGVYDKTSVTNKNLTSNKNYYYKVRTYITVNNKKVYSDYSAVKTAKTKAVPIVSGLTVSAKTYNSVSLKWTAVAGATSYQLYRGVAGSDGTISWSFIGTYKTNSCNNSGLKTGTKYYYKVRALITEDSKTNYGAFSSSVNAIPELSKPVFSKYSAASTSSVSLTWNAVAGAKYYEVYRSTAASGATWTKLGIYDKTSITNKSLKSATTYYYKVRCYTVVNGNKVYSAYSKVVSVKTK